MQHSKHTGLNLKRKITASLLSLAILGTGTLPLVSTVVASAAEDGDSVGAASVINVKQDNNENKTVTYDGKTENVFWASAKYYDYLTDSEVNGTWRTSITQSGTGHSGSEDDWYPFKKFNKYISGIAASSGWSTPLYFGNFYNGNDGPYATSSHNGGYMNAKDGLTNWNHAPNNSRKGFTDHDCKTDESGTTVGLDREHQSYQGLVDSTLKDGNLTVAGGTTAPYFQANDTYVKEFQSSFPFREDTHTDYTKYIFKSSTSNNTKPSDNVYFNWSGNTPTDVNYNYGSAHAVKDGKRYFMYNEASGYGIYPFNGVGQEKDGKTYRYLYASVDHGYPSLSEWTNLKCYFMGASGQSWPGTQMKFVRDEGNNKVFKVQIPNGATGFVLNNGNGNNWNQTVNGSYDDMKFGAVYVDKDQISGGDDNDKHKINRWGDAPSDAGISEYTYNTEKLNHGFGVHLTVPFRVPGEHLASDGKTVIPAGKSEEKDSSGNYTRISFDFAGDDDLWMFITDNTTKQSQLVLDLGGNHKVSKGHVYFDTLEAVAEDVYTKGKTTKKFDFDYSHTYTMDVFYMERGMIESNCDMSFTMTPLGNNFIVTEKIDTTKVNAGLVDDVTALSKFTFTPNQNGTTHWENGLNYNIGGTNYNKSGKDSIDLGSGQLFSIANFFKINDEMLVTQTRGESVLKYTTDYVFKNNTTGEQLDKAHKDSSVETVATGKGFLSNTGTASGDPYEFAELQADFVNTPEVADVTISKETVDFLNQRLVAGDKGQGEVFPITVALNFGGSTTGGLYDFEYTKGTVSGTADKGKLTIKDGDTITIPNVPIGTTVTVSEDISNSTNFDLKEVKPESFTVTKDGTNSSAITNIRKLPEPTTDKVTVNKTIFTKTFEDKSTATLGDGYKFELYYGETKLDTITITDPSSDTASDVFKDLKFTVNEADKGKEAQGIFYIAPETFKNGGSKEFTFTVKEALTDDQKKAIDQPADQTATIIIYYDKANNKLTNIPPDQVGSVPNPDHTTDFVNPYNVGSVSITKTVTRDSGELDDQDKNTAFTINVSFSFNGNTYPNGVPFYYTVNGGSKTYQLGSSQSISLKHGETASFDGLPVGTTVTVSESNPGAEYSPSVSPESVKITEKGQAFNVVVTNKRQAPGTTSFPVQFKKQFNYGTLEADAFEFEMLEGDGLKGDKVKNTAQGVVDFGTVNVEYSKTAKDPANKTVYLDDSKFTDDIATLTYKAKEADGKKANIFYDGDEITYTVKIKRTVTAAQTTLEFVSGTYAKGKDNAESDTFVNNCLGDIKITKEVRNAADAEKAKPFKADVEIALMKADGTLSEFAAIPYIYTYEGGKTEATTTLDLYDGRVYTLSGLPMGSQVKVTEQSAKYPNYSVTYDPQIVTVGETASTAKVINTLQAPGQVTLGVNKTFTQDAVNAGVDLEAKGNKFSFTMTAEANNPVLKDYTSTVTLDKYQDGKLVTSGEFAAIVFPPEYAYGQGTDVAFKVVENSAIEGNDGSIIYDTAAYSVVYTVKQGESGLDISAPVITKSKNGDTSAPGTVSFENGYPVGSVEIKKLVKDFDGANLEAYKTEAFPIKVTITTPDGTTDVRETTVSAAQSVKYDKLPYGTTVTVEETDAKGMTASIDKAAVTVSKETPAPTVTITNTRETLNPTDVQVPAKKVIKGADIADYQQAFLFELNGNGITMQAQNDVKGDVLFDKINFRIKKSADDKAEANTILVDKSAFASSDTVAYTFAVKEIPADRPDITFDNNTYNVTVNVKKTETLNAITLSASVDKTTVPTFTNQKLGRAILYKVVKDIDGTGFKPDVDFKFSLKVDGKVVKDDIIINVSKDETSRFVTGYYPVDTVLTFEETDAKGFECTEPVKTVTIIDETGEIPSAEVEFVNRRPQPGQTSITLSALKTVSGYKLSANDFSFTAKGKGLDETKKNNENGNIVFSTITYKYTKGNEADTGNTVYLRDGDFTDGKAVLNYEIKETKGNNTDITYASNTVKAVVTVKKTETASDIQLSATAAYPDGTTFNNPVRTGSATIIKKDQEGNPVDGIEFTLFKVTSDGLSREEVLANGSVVDAKTTSGGKVTFNDLDLYKDASRTLSNPEYQWYCFAETDPGDNHNLNSELTFFRVPTEGVYDVEFTYMNGKITSPTSGGEGMFTFKLVGSILLAFASALLAGYVFFFSKKSGKKSAHSVK